LTTADLNKIAVIGPSFFGYVEAVASNLASFGYQTQFFDERHSNSIASKIFYRLGYDYLIKRDRIKHLDSLQEVILSRGFGSVLLVDIEVIDLKFVEFLKFHGIKVFLYMWDSAKNKPGFTDMIDAVDSAASFEPVDCEKLGMVYIPLFAEEIFRSNSLNIQRTQNSIGFNGTMHSLRAKQLAAVESILKGKYNIEKFLYYHSKFLYLVKCLANPLGLKYFSKISTRAFPKLQIANLYKRSVYVLDIHHPGQSGLTSRTFEALRSGAYLITFNKSVASLPASLAARCVCIEDVKDISDALDNLAISARLNCEDDYFLSLERFSNDILQLMSLPQKSLTKDVNV
jgi:hypothetical protein